MWIFVDIAPCHVPAYNSQVRLMIEWLIQRSANHPHLARGVPPEGFLSAAERTVFDNLYSARRRKDWLLGRWTAKKIVQTEAEKLGKRLSCSQISILAGKDGAPGIWFCAGDGLRPANFSLSISHSKGASFCAVLQPGMIPLGADMEVVEPRPRGFVESYFTEAEKEIIHRASPEQRDHLTTAIWSGKEAALKAVRQGLRLDTRSLNCLFPLPFRTFAGDLELDSWHPFIIQWRSDPTYPALSGWWRVWQEYILTLVTTVESKPVPGCLWQIEDIN
jgi:4'-phosphopantetheinyl transferase